MSIAKTINLLLEVREHLTELAEDEYDLGQLQTIFSDEAEIREAAPIYWAAETIGKAIQLLTPHADD